MVNLEETLNQTQSNLRPIHYIIDGQCPKCQSISCNLLDVQTVLGGVDSKAVLTKEYIEEEEDEIVIDD